ncbi:MAG: hypothetical protein IPK82_15305 [Polyangiaceae bacterium]|nr:hypothetical protein [Polyangiaceae bacterium]
MLLSKGSVKLRSLSLSPLVLAATVGLAGAAGTGCFFVDHDHHDDWDDDTTDTPDNPDVPNDPAQVSEVMIQPDLVLEAKPGEGVGIFVEYQSGGKWRIWTTCDTFTSKQVCAYDIFAATRLPTDLRAYALEDAEGFDEVKDLGEGMVELIADTDSDTDALVLETEPGASLDIEVYIDGQSAQPYVYWVSNDVIHVGTPDNPTRFVPQAP